MEVLHCFEIDSREIAFCELNINQKSRQPQSSNAGAVSLFLVCKMIIIIHLRQNESC